VSKLKPMPILRIDALELFIEDIDFNKILEIVR
jgi:hypothetical protein